MQSHKKNFGVEESYYGTEVCLVLYQCFVKETAPKCGCVVDFFAISLLTMRTYTHMHPCSLELVDQSLHIEKMFIGYSSQKKRNKVGFLYSVLFYGRLNCFAWLCGFITFLW